MTLAAYDGVNAPTLRVQFYKSGTWTDVTASDVIGVHFMRGRQRADMSIAPLAATIDFDNRSGFYDSDYLGGSSPWVVSGASILRAGLRCRLVATWSSVDYVLFTGVLETPDLDAGFAGTASMTFVDDLAAIAKVEMPILPNYQHALETTATRVGRLLTACGFTGTRSLNGTIQMQSTTEGMNAMALIQQCVDVQAGAFYISRTGVATLLDLSHKFSRPTALLFDDSRTVANSIEYDAIKTTSGALQVINQCVVTRGKYKQKVATYNPSVSKWGLHTKKIEALVDSDVHAQNLAIYYARKDADPTTTVKQIEFSALSLGTLFPDFLSMELLDQITVNRTTVDGRTLVMNLVVEGIQQTITPTSWRVTLYTSPMNSFSITL